LNDSDGLSLVIAAFLVFLLADRRALLLLVHDEPRPRLLLVPFETGQDRVLELVVCL